MEMASELVREHVAAGTLSPEQMRDELVKTYNMFQKMQKAQEEGVLMETGAGGRGEAGTALKALREDPSSSIGEKEIVCLECGRAFNQLTAKHLQSHQLDPREYKRKWGFRLRQPLSAVSVSKKRSRAAKKRGLNPGLREHLDSRKARKEERERQAEANTE